MPTPAEKERPEAPDQLTLGLALDDKPLKEIFRNLYYPDSPYEFSVLPADILGQVYEQFLGKVIRLTAYCLGSGDLYLLGILNSRLVWFAISHISIPFGVRAGEYRYRLIYQYMEQVPIRPIDANDPADRARHGKMVALVESMLSLHKQLAAANTAHDKPLIQRQIGASDKQIDRLVYELYGLTEDEVGIVEQA